MGIINIYNTISAQHNIENKNGKLKDILPEIDFNKTIILKAGTRVDPDYEVTADDVLYVRVTPSAAETVAAVVLISGFIVGAGYVTGKIISNTINSQKQKELEKAQKDAKNLAEQIQQLPCIKGANNKSALGQAVPYVMGDVYNTPYKLTDGCYTIENGNTANNEWGKYLIYWVPLSLGFGRQLVKKILLGDETILERQEGTEQGDYSFKSDSVYYNTSNAIFLRKAGQNFSLPNFSNKIISVQDGSEIKHDFGSVNEDLIRTLPEHAQSVTVCIQFNGLRQYKQSMTGGYWDDISVIVKPYWTNVDNPSADDWHEFYFNSPDHNLFTFNTNKQLRFTATKEFTAEECYGKKIKIKIRRSAKQEYNSNEDCYLLYYQSTIYDNAKSTSANLVTCQTVESDLINSEVRLGLKIVADDNTKDLINEIHVLSCGMARTWNGSSWSIEKTATRNPAAWILDILTSSVHNHSKFSDDEIDLTSLGRLYEYCEDNEFFTDGIVSEGIKKRDLLTTILSSVNATMIINYEGKYEFIIDKVEDTPVALINSENISSISYAKELSRKPDGLKVTFINRNSWQVDTFYAMLNGKQRTQNDTLLEINYDYVTTHSHAYKLAQRMMKQQILQPREITVDVGREGDFYPLYSTVMLQYTTFRQGLNSSVISKIKASNGKITGFTLEDLVIFEKNKNYGLIIQAQNQTSKQHLYLKVVNTDNATREIMLLESINESENHIEIGNICSFGELGEENSFDKITNTMKITGITPNENGYSLILRDYNHEIYSAGTIPEYKSNLTQPPKAAKQIPTYELLEGEKGANGTSTYTLQLFRRYADIPPIPSGSLTYTFNPPALSGDLEGWSQSMPPVDDDNNPLYEIHVTLFSESSTVSVSPSDFSEPAIILQDSNLTIADVQEMINKVSPPPTVEADVTFFGIAVNEKGVCPKTQSVTTEIHVRQTEEELGFEIENVEVPEGFEYTVDENKITITCKKDSLVKSGSILVPVKYRAYKSNIAYVNNEDANNYYIGSGNILGNFDSLEDIPSNPAEDSIINWIGETTPMNRASDDTFIKDTAYQYIQGKWKKFDFTPYGYFVYADDYSVSNIGIGFTQVKGFRYLNSIDDLENIPEDIILGDYFTWNGNDLESDLVEGGIFKQCCIYSWNGTYWELDTTTEHNTTALFDVLKIANSNLSENNSTAQTFLDRLCSNQAFIKTLVVTGSAFINELQALNIYAQQIIAAKNDAIDNTLTQLVGAGNVVNHTIIDGGHIITDLIDAEEIRSGLVTTDEITSGSGTFTGLKADLSEFTNSKIQSLEISGLFKITQGQEYTSISFENISFKELLSKLEYLNIFKYQDESGWKTSTGKRALHGILTGKNSKVTINIVYTERFSSTKQDHFIICGLGTNGSTSGVGKLEKFSSQSGSEFKIVAGDFTYDYYKNGEETYTGYFLI